VDGSGNRMIVGRGGGRNEDDDTLAASSAARQVVAGRGDRGARSLLVRVRLLPSQPPRLRSPTGLNIHTRIHK